MLSAETADCRVSNCLGRLQIHCFLAVQIPYNLLDGLRDKCPSRNTERIREEFRETASLLIFSVSQIQQVWIQKFFFFWLALNYYCKRVTSNFLHHVCCLALLILSLLQETELVVSEEIYWNSSHNTFLFFCATIHISEESQLKITFKPSKSVSQVCQQWW